MVPTRAPAQAITQNVGSRSSRVPAVPETTRAPKAVALHAPIVRNSSSGTLSDAAAAPTPADFACAALERKPQKPPGSHRRVSVTSHMRTPRPAGMDCPSDRRTIVHA
jgi:hypothetical protein